MSAGKVILGFLAGATVGAALGILYAPAKGSETRRKIAEKSEGYADVLGTKFNELIEGVAQQFESLKEDAEQKMQNAKHSTLDPER